MAQDFVQLNGLKQDNRDVVFELVRTRGQTTRTELARLAGLSKATISEIVSGLIQDGFVRETGKRRSGRGRSRVLLEFDPTARLVLGAQLDDKECTVVLADLTAQPRAKVTVPVHGGSPAVFVAAICRGVEELLPRAEAPILGLGVGVPGSVEPTGRTVTISVPYGWRHVPIAAQLEERLDLPVLAANRAKVAALGEVWHGAGKGVNDLVYVFVGAGIVAGLVINGKLYFGSVGGAGELGHVTVVPNGLTCGCGNRGCLHTLASESAIVHLARAKARLADDSVLRDQTDGIFGQITLELILDAASRGDAVALETLAEAGTHLGVAIANLVNIVNPQMVVVGGSVARVGDPFLGPVGREVRRRALGDSLAQLEIVQSTLGDEAGAIGAAALLLERLGSILAAASTKEHALAVGTL